MIAEDLSIVLNVEQICEVTRMKIVIDIDKEEYEMVKAHPGCFNFSYAIINGTPLPKGHGRLIDADVISKRLQELADDEWNQQVMASKGLEYAVEIIDDAPTIIEAESDG